MTQQQIKNLAAEFENIKQRAGLIAAQTAQAEASAKNLSEQARAKYYENEYNKIIANYFSGNEMAAIADRIGINAAELLKLAKGVFKGAFKNAPGIGRFFK